MIKKVRTILLYRKITRISLKASYVSGKRGKFEKQKPPSPGISKRFKIQVEVCRLKSGDIQGVMSDKFEKLHQMNSLAAP